MAKGSDVLAMLRPDGGWVIYGDDFDSIIYDEGIEPVSAEEFESGFAIVDKWLTDLENAKIQKKNELLDKLGITEEEAKLLLS